MVRRAVVLGLGFVLFTIQPTLGGAALVTHTYSQAAITVTTAVAEFYDYNSASTVAWTNTADFDGGSYVSTNATDVPDAVVLDRIGPTGVVAPDPAVTWWDTAWTNRRCFDLDHTATSTTTVTEYQLRLSFPIESLVTDGFVQADLGDLRALGADGTTPLPLWVDDTEPDTLWVQMDTITAGDTTDLCIYYAHESGAATRPSNHTEAAVFSYTTAKDIYYAVSSIHTAPGTPVNVVSYTDSNVISRDDGTSIPLAAGDLGTFDAVGTTPGSVFSVLGPISATVVVDGGDSLVPISYAGTSFLAPISRDLQHFSFVAPFGDASVDLYDGTTLVATFNVASGLPYSHTVGDIRPGNTAIIESDVPVLVTHLSDTGGDAIALYPAQAGAFYPVRSSSVLVGYGTDTTAVAVAGSDGSLAAAPADRGVAITIGGGTVAGGTASDGLLLSADQPVGVISHDDGDGTESVTVLPRSELNSRYLLATDSQYVAFACPTEESTPVSLTVTAPGGADRPVTCSGGPDVAWASDTADLLTTTSGTVVASTSGSPFWAYYEDLTTDDQIGLLGMKQGRQLTWPEPVVTSGPDEGIFEASGTWESATFTTGAGSGVFGLVRPTGSTPAGTDIRLQIATIASGIPTDFVGPDGTSATHFSIGSLPAVADFDHDGQRFLRIRAELESTDRAAVTPRLDGISLDHNLELLDRSLGAPPPIALVTTLDPTVTTSYLLRVKTADPDIAGSEATAVYRGAVNLANLGEETVRFVNERLGVDSVQQSTSTATDPAELFQVGRPHSIVLDHSALASGVTEVLFAWQLDYSGAGSVFFETDFAVEVTAP